jgi:hypothetical protein
MYSLKRLSSKELLDFAPLALPSVRAMLGKGGLGPKLIAVGATLFDTPIGLAVSTLDEAGAAAIHSVVVTPQQMRIGVGTALLSWTERELAANRCTSIEIMYLSDGPYTAAFERILSKNSWPTPSQCALIGRTNYATISKAPWVKQWSKWAFPSEFQVFAWAEITTRERAYILERQTECPWFPKCVNPFSRESQIEPRASLGLRYNGQIIGWSLARRKTSNVLSHSYFVEKQPHRPSLGLALLAQCIMLGGRIPQQDFVFDIPLDSPVMNQFIHQRLLPYVISARTISRATKKVALPA